MNVCNHNVKYAKLHLYNYPRYYSTTSISGSPAARDKQSCPLSSGTVSSVLSFLLPQDTQSSSGQSGQSGQSAPTAVELFSRFAKSPKPFVGRINGHCVAGGMGLAAAMDISVALDSAKMGFTEVRLGLAPAMVSVLCLPKMRLAQASEAFLRGKRFLAPEAVSMGIINHAVSADRIDAVTDRIVADLLLGGQNALAVCKQLTQRIPAMATEDAFEWTSKISAQLFASEDGQEGIRAFTEKRAPSWAPRPG